MVWVFDAWQPGCPEKQHVLLREKWSPNVTVMGAVPAGGVHAQQVELGLENDSATFAAVIPISLNWFAGLN
jgi:hypothetical protein